MIISNFLFVTYTINQSSTHNVDAILGFTLYGGTRKQIIKFLMFNQYMFHIILLTVDLTRRFNYLDSGEQFSPSNIKYKIKYIIYIKKKIFKSFYFYFFTRIKITTCTLIGILSNLDCI
jgi:hypothetical protein